MSLQEDIQKIYNLHEELKNLRPLNEGEVKRLLEQFAIENTYNSNAIEGSSLTLGETALIIQQGITIAERPLREHLEAVNHKEAFDFVVEIAQQHSELSLYNIKQIHSLVLMHDRRNAGIFRDVPVVILGASYKPPQPYLIEPQMNDLVDKYNKSKEELFERLARFHLDFERIHPFVDGNGRTGRLLINLELIKAGYLPIDIKYANRRQYYNSFNEYDKTGDITIFEEMMVNYELMELENYVAIVKDAAEFKKSRESQE